MFKATEEERKRLSCELHDGVGQQLGGIKHRLEHARSSGWIFLLPEVISTSDGTAKEVRDLAHQLMPKALSHEDWFQPCGIGVQDVCGHFAREFGITWRAR